MYKIEWGKERILLAIMAAVTAAVVASYPALPQVLPMHWDINGHVNSVAPKSFVSAFFPLGIIWGMFFLLLYIPYIDPKRERYAQFLDAYRVIRFAIITMTCCVSLLVTAWSLGYRIPVEKSIPAVVALEYIFIGNMMGKIRMNWFVGMRLPWTMEDDEVWNRTNRLTGRLFVASGLLTLAGILFPAPVTFGVLIGSIFLTTIISAVYSFILYKKRHK